MAEVTQILADIGRGDPTAPDRLLSLVYPELRAIAARHLERDPLHPSLQATALADEAWLRLAAQRRVEWRDRAHFFAVAAMAIRRLLVDHARRRRAARRGGERQRITLHEGLQSTGPSEVDLLALDEALERLSALDPRQGRVVELRFFAGLSVAETSHVLGVSERTVKGDWQMARAWLRREIEKGEAP